MTVMELKDYQRRVMDEVDLYLRALAKEQAAGKGSRGVCLGRRETNVRNSHFPMIL